MKDTPNCSGVTQVEESEHCGEKQKAESRKQKSDSAEKAESKKQKAEIGPESRSTENSFQLSAFPISAFPPSAFPRIGSGLG